MPAALFLTLQKYTISIKQNFKNSMLHSIPAHGRFLEECMLSSQKDALRRMRENGKSYGQIAAALGLSENTVKSYCRRTGLQTFVARTICPQCGKILLPEKHGRRRFCSDACRYAWAYSHRILGPQNAIQKQCAACKKPFFSYPSSHRKYCSHGCYIADRYGREAERHG